MKYLYAIPIQIINRMIRISSIAMVSEYDELYNFNVLQFLIIFKTISKMI